MEVIKDYFKYIIVCAVILVLLGISYYFYNTSNKEIDEEPIVLKKKDNKKANEVSKENIKYVYVDIKGAVNSPNVYILEDGKRVIDAINIAGGILENA